MKLFSSLKKRFGLWLCSKGFHKMETHFGFDYAHKEATTGTLAISKVCKRCGLITIEGIHKVGKIDLNMTYEPMDKSKVCGTWEYMGEIE